MNFTELADISFDKQDANLFLVDDARLRADALKHSVLPRLRIVMNCAITYIREVYATEALDDSIVSVFPNFRENRYKDNALTLQYDAAFVGFGGKRKAMWPGFARKDGKPVQILPFRFAFVLSEEGMNLFFQNGWLKGLHQKSFESLLQFHIDNEDVINRLCQESRIRPNFYFADDLPYFAPLKEHYHHRILKSEFDNDFIGHRYHFPASVMELHEMVDDFMTFYPVYDSYIQMAKGLPHRLDKLVGKLNNWVCRKYQPTDDNTEELSTPENHEAAIAALSAEQKVRVMPALRWQVFQRDQWKCVSCGRDSHSGAILHVDHIIPRSRGGHDKLENYQTLCDVCNVGKSNKDATDLRKKI